MIQVTITGKREVAENVTIAHALAQALDQNTLLTMERADRLLAGETLVVEVPTVEKARTLCQTLNDLRLHAEIAAAEAP